MATRLEGGCLILGSGATPLDSDTPCRQLVMRAEPNAIGLIYYGNSDVSSSTAVGYFYGRESAGYGPLQLGCGIKPNSIYLLGAQGTKVYWWAFPA